MLAFHAVAGVKVGRTTTETVIVRVLKLKPTPLQSKRLDEWLWILTGVYNWAIRKIGNDAHDSVYYTEMEFCNLLANHSKKVAIPSHVLQATLRQAFRSWQRFFNKLSKRPHLKGARNKFTVISFPDPVRSPKGGRLDLPGIRVIKVHKQNLPEAPIKNVKLVKRPSGWYVFVWLDCDHHFPVKKTEEAVGIDPGFITLLTLSNGITFSNPRELHVGAKRLAQANRGRRKRLSGRLQERQRNRRRDRNHKISRKIVENYSTICYSNDNFKALATMHGKAVHEAGLGGLIGYLTYKCRTGGRTLVPVNSQFTTMTCSVCGARNGPHGWGGLAVRQWNCACGAQHDRDVNAARNVLFAGAGCALKESVIGFNQQEDSQ